VDGKCNGTCGFEIAGREVRDCLGWVLAGHEDLLYMEKMQKTGAS
jgi:hypothetical protein